MTRRERFNRTMRFQSVDRVINLEFGYWDGTIERWQGEGLPPDCRPISKTGQDDPLARFLNLDMHWLGCIVNVNNAGPLPAFEKQVLEEDEETRVIRNTGGVILRECKTHNSMPQYIEFPVRSREDFEKHRCRFDPHSPERYPDNWASLVKEYRERDYPLGLNINGFFGQPRNWMGFENVAYAYYDQPDLMSEMCEFWADFNIEFSRRIFAEVELDFVHFWEDMAFNHGSMVSPLHFRKYMAPAYQKVMDFIRAQGIDIVIVDSDGLVEELIPLFLEMGINCILPVEVKAGNDPVAMRKKYGERLRLIGGINKRALTRGVKAIEEEMRSKVPFLLSKGGYIPALDHTVPADVSLDNYKSYLDLKTKLIAG